MINTESIKELKNLDLPGNCLLENFLRLSIFSCGYITFRFTNFNKSQLHY